MGSVHALVGMVSLGQGLSKVARFVGVYKGSVLFVDADVFSYWMSPGFLWGTLTIFSKSSPLFKHR